MSCRPAWGTHQIQAAVWSEFPVPTEPLRVKQSQRKEREVTKHEGKWRPREEAFLAGRLGLAGRAGMEAADFTADCTLELKAVANHSRAHSQSQGGGNKSTRVNI